MNIIYKYEWYNIILLYKIYLYIIFLFCEAVKRFRNYFAVFALKNKSVHFKDLFPHFLDEIPSF
jgi:hypothetical protein